VIPDRYDRGLDAFASQLGIPREEVPTWFAERFGERFGEETISAAGGVWQDEALSLRDRSLIVVAALIAQGGLEDRLRLHVRWAVEHGCTGAELEELATLLGMYAGFPRASAGMAVVREELARMEG
jgi:4-carboxymuconolactone decarboxylase